MIYSVIHYKVAHHLESQWTATQQRPLWYALHITSRFMTEVATRFHWLASVSKRSLGYRDAPVCLLHRIHAQWFVGIIKTQQVDGAGR